MKVGRNQPCPCGSGKKYKQCCLKRDSGTLPLQYKLLIALFLLIAAGGIVSLLASIGDHDGAASPRAGLVWSEEHQHWH